MDKIIFRVNTGGHGGEFVELTDRYMPAAQVTIQDVNTLGEIIKYGKGLLFIDFKSGIDKKFSNQKEAVSYGLELYKERAKKEFLNKVQ